MTTERVIALYRAAPQDGYDPSTASSGQMHNDATGKTGPFTVKVAELTVQKDEIPVSVVLVYGAGSIEERFDLHVGQGKGRGTHYREAK